MDEPTFSFQSDIIYSILKKDTDNSQDQLTD